jgi:hypothetical protein
MRQDRLSVHCRTDTGGKARSIRCEARSAVWRPVHAGQKALLVAAIDQPDVNQRIRTILGRVVLREERSAL